MVAAAPEGSPPRRISNKQFKKTLPAVPRRGPEAGFHRVHYDFHGLGANTLFMPVSPEHGKTVIRKHKPCLHPLHFRIRDKPDGFSGGMHSIAPGNLRFNLIPGRRDQETLVHCVDHPLKLLHRDGKGQDIHRNAGSC